MGGINNQTLKGEHFLNPKYMRSNLLGIPAKQYLRGGMQKTHRSVSQFHNDWIANLLLVGDQPLLTQRGDQGIYSQLCVCGRGFSFLVKTNVPKFALKIVQIGLKIISVIKYPVVFQIN